MNTITAPDPIATRESAELLRLKMELTELRVYLALPKFHVDTTVQVRDILTRLDSAESAATDAYWGAL